MHISTENIGSSSPTTRADEPFQMINLPDIVLDVAPLSMISAPTQKKAMPSVSKNVKTSGKSSVSEPTIPSEDKTVVEKGSRSRGYEMRNSTKNIGVTDNQTEAKRFPLIRKFGKTIPDGDSSEKADECVPEQAAHERRSKKKADYVINVDELTFDEEPITNILAHGIAKILQRRKGKAMMFEDSPSNEIKRKYGGMKSTPSRSSKGKSPVGHARSWSKVVIPLRKREVVSSSLAKEFVVTIPDGCDNAKSEYYRKVYVRGNAVTFSPAVINKFLGRTEEPQDELEVTNDQVCKEITAKQVKHRPNRGKLSVGKLSVKYVILHRIGTVNWVPTNHTSTISIGLGEFIYVIGTRRTFDFGKYIFEQVMKQAFSTVVKMPICFPSLMCGIIPNQHPRILLPIDSVKKMESPLSLHYKLFAGTHVPDIVMTSSQVPGPATSKESVITQMKETCKELDDSTQPSIATKIELENLIKDLMDEEEKEVEHVGDDNVGADVEDSAGGNDDVNDEDKEAEGE
ncbi:uncharacterized protein LOC127103905 [Lathyrus oleraceus]|uniref:uncharacterized protein LOC127103905 n=1 Tax=Pisum sativum TaxID=3888 RepID=UPI0021D03389|nr:uncharacterized protein LOC127103905 [Pisum sativum]